MRASLLGMGWVTPLGRSLPEVYRAIREGHPPEAKSLENPFSKKEFPIFHVAPESIADAVGLPRLRRSSAISHFAVAAAIDAVQASGLPAEAMARTALIFAASDGGVVYTRRFYADVVERGPGAGSPLLFPETVYNAPASHIAARLGIEGTALSLVGDSVTAFSAIQTAAELLEADDVDYCLVVASQELDWITCEAYEYWTTGKGAVYSDGAAAIVLAKASRTLPTLHLHPGATYTTTKDAALRLSGICRSLIGDVLPRLVVPSSSATLKEVEQSALCSLLPDANYIDVKQVLGEAHCASTLQQVIAAALATETEKNESTLVSAIGFNGQVSALILTPANLHA